MEQVAALLPAWLNLQFQVEKANSIRFILLTPTTPTLPAHLRSENQKWKFFVVFLMNIYV